MSNIEILSILQWWSVIFFIGLVCIPLTFALFPTFFDKGYIFSKILGLALLSYSIFILGVIHIMPFTRFFSFCVLIGIGSTTLAIFWQQRKSLAKTVQVHWKVFLFEEMLFLAAIFFWSFVRGFAPDIHGLEKYMDFGFMNSILRADYFPPKDMWYTPFPINYYYFGHFTAAVITRLSNLSSSITYNLMLATVFAFTFTGAFSLGANLWYACKGTLKRFTDSVTVYIAGIIAGLLLTFGGNLHTIYTFFKAYENDHPVPIWQLQFLPGSFPNNYWYPNATRFIYHTIHEFPMYSFVVSDLHGHVLDIPFVLLIIAVLLSLIFKLTTPQDKHIKHVQHGSWNIFEQSGFTIWNILLLGFLLAIMYMTNAWDGMIYFLLSAMVMFSIRMQLVHAKHSEVSIQYIVSRMKQNKTDILHTFYSILLTLGFFLFFATPFSLFFQPGSIAHGIGVLCAPTFLTNIGKIGPFLFEPNHCQHSPWWQLFILYGFFYFWAFSFLGLLFIKRKQKNFLRQSDIFILLLIVIATLFIITPEFVYLKDIYPDHYRANTMFKLVYQSFMMLCIVSAYSMLRIVASMKQSLRDNTAKLFALCYSATAIACTFLVAIYPHFAINSYYGDFKVYHGLDGTTYLANLYPTDYAAIQWLNKNIKDQPVILEAQGDSYTDYERVSTNTGLPTVLGWTVHEWLWRGSYDIVAPRIIDVQTLYETKDLSTAKLLIGKYHISLVFIGDLEKQKYKDLSEDKFQKLGKIIYQNRNTRIYKILS